MMDGEMDVGVPSLLATVVLSLAVAYVLGLAARAVRLPPLVGYLVAGIVVGPFTPGLYADQRVVAGLADIGVALLLFGVGLHFSLADLLRVWRIAVPGALLQIAGATAIGYAVAHWLLGWPKGGALFLGLGLAISSSAVATRALEDRGRLSGEAGRVALGWLVIQDLVVIASMVLVTAVTGAGSGNGGLAAALGKTALELAGFVVVVILLGRKLVPWALRLTARAGSRELFTLAVILAALGVAYGSAELFHVSLALGAFFAGVVLAESDLSHQAAAESLSVQQLFTVLFFVSVGLLFDPGALVRMPVTILVALATILIGTGAIALLLLLAFRMPAPIAVAVAAALAQIGEFSFILAGQGVAQGIMPAEGRDLILAAALLAIVANPFLTRAADALGRWIDRRGFLSAWTRAGLPRGEAAAGIAGHALVIGQGRVGGIVVTALRRHDVPVVAIEQDRELAEAARRDGVAVIYGDASRPEVLHAAHPERAKLLVVAIPDRFYARRIIDLARASNPSIDTVVRTHTDEEAEWLKRREVGLVIMSERETALGMAEYALRKFVADPEAARSTLEELREA
jgi:monovalent cation:H+ antiporter-2, CPA2 family